MIKSKIIDIISKHTGVPASSITISQSLTEDLMASDALYSTIIEDLETTFNLTIPVHALDGFYTVYDIIEYIKKHQQE